MIRCYRCGGAKKLYKVGGGYTMVNNGSPLIDCPLCLGKGEIKPLEEVLKDNNIESKTVVDKSEKPKELPKKTIIRKKPVSKKTEDKITYIAEI